MSEHDYMIVGLCCELCKKHETSGCPVKEASPWSRWVNFCNRFENDNGRTLLDLLPKELCRKSLNKTPNVENKELEK